jgi:hydrogenase expression/formation protein HypE
MDRIPIGKLPHGLLTEMLDRYALPDPRLTLGPGVGLDCAVIEFGDRFLVAKSDPITFTAEEIGWYAVHINANDVATTGARPRWFLATLLLPEESTDATLVDRIFSQIHRACVSLGAVLVGGHTEISAGLDRTIVVGTMLGEVTKSDLITPLGAEPGHLILLTKGVPIEATSILAHEFAAQMSEIPVDVLARAKEFIREPGISVLREAIAASEIGGVSAMHDPTEGGLAAGLWELSQAAHVGLVIELEKIHVPEEAHILCQAMAIDPLEAIASGALLLTVQPDRLEPVRQAIEEAGVSVAEIGWVTEGAGVIIHSEGDEHPMRYPSRDAIARLFEDDSVSK